MMFGSQHLLPDAVLRTVVEGQVWQWELVEEEEAGEMGREGEEGGEVEKWTLSTMGRTPFEQVGECVGKGLTRRLLFPAEN